MTVFIISLYATPYLHFTLSLKHYVFLNAFSATKVHYRVYDQAPKDTSLILLNFPTRADNGMFL